MQQLLSLGDWVHSCQMSHILRQANLCHGRLAGLQCNSARSIDDGWAEQQARQAVASSASAHGCMMAGRLCKVHGVSHEFQLISTATLICSAWSG